MRDGWMDGWMNGCLIMYRYLMCGRYYNVRFGPRVYQPKLIEERTKMEVS